METAGHPVDVLSVHFYPQGGEFGDDVSTNMKLTAQPLHAAALGSA